METAKLFKLNDRIIVIDLWNDQSSKNSLIILLQVRGDPDGCGLDISGIRYSPTSELRVDLPAEDLLNIKKGWLMKQGLSKVRHQSDLLLFLQSSLFKTRISQEYFSQNID